MCGFYFITFIKYMTAGETLLDYTNLFSPNDYKKMTKYYISTLNRNMAEEEKEEEKETCFKFRLRKFMKQEITF